MTLRFGTDGVRGLANVELTPELALALGRAAARVLGADRPFVLARDTRRSGPMLEAALTAGLAAEGADVLVAGVMPTPGAAYLSQSRDCPAAVLSASHNPFPDNGIKFFARGGRKLSDDVEARFEAEIDALVAGQAAATRVEGPAVGSVRVDEGALREYETRLLTTLEGRRLDGLSVVVDCGNGAAAVAAPWVLSQLGAKVENLDVGAHPDGANINAGCGSTHPETLQAEVVDRGAAAGLAFDGDADRLVAVDERGGLVDGDHILAVAALDLRARGRLRHDTVVATVMANLGFHHAMAALAKHVALELAPVEFRVARAIRGHRLRNRLTLEHRGGHHDLEYRSRRELRLNRTIQQRMVVVFIQALPVFFGNTDCEFIGVASGRYRRLERLGVLRVAYIAEVFHAA